MFKKLSSFFTIKNIAVLTLVLIIIFRFFSLDQYLEYSDSGKNIVLIAQDFLTLFLSMVIEAFPFIVLGVFISGVIGSKLFFGWGKFPIIKNINSSLSRVDGKFNKNRFYSHLKLAFLGVFLPVCECGNVPLARRLLISNYSTSQTITFLLAAPILNPVTFLTTYEAFNFEPKVLILRMVGGFIVAMTVGLIFSLAKNQDQFLTNDFYQELCVVRERKENEGVNRLIERLKEFLHIFNHEFIEVFPSLCLGALIAAASQSFLPRDLIISIGSNPVFSVIAMLFLAFIISICSNVDAFFALSYSNTFSIGAIASFLVFGPMIDIKILTMLKNIFKPKTLVIMTTLVFLLSLIVGLLSNLLF